MKISFSLQTVKASVCAVLIGLVATLLLAVVCYFFPLPRTAVLVITQTIKGVSLLLGCWLCLYGEGGWWKGLLTGAIFCALSFLVFASLSGDKGSLLALVDLAICLLIGGLGGIMAVNLKRN